MFPRLNNNSSSSKTNKESNDTHEKNKEKDNIKKKPNGLIKPGSNWETCRHLIYKQADKEKEAKTIGNLSHPKKHRKHYRNPLTTTQPNELLQTQNNSMDHTHNPSDNLMQAKSQQSGQSEITKHIAIDCEMVGIGDGSESMIARVSLVNRHGVCIYDKYVKPTERVQDYRTAVSGIRPQDLKNGEEFKVVQEEVAKILRGRILVGHAMKNDLAVLYLSHPKRNLRDTSRYKPFRKVTMGNTPSLKKLALELLGIDIQSGEHNSIEDARTAMQLYMLHKKHWECDLRKRH